MPLSVVNFHTGHTTRGRILIRPLCVRLFLRFFVSASL